MRKERAKEFNKRVEKSGTLLSIGERKTCEIFIRGEHPDKRTNAQWLKIIKEKNKTKWYPKKIAGRIGFEIKCLNNGKIYGSIRDAAKQLKINNTNLSRHLRGHKRYTRVGGMKFEYV